MEALLPLILTFGLMWALLIRPQQRRVRQHQELVATLSDGDEVITTGGIVGTIASVVDDIVTLDVAPGTSIRVLRSAIQSRIAAFGGDEAYDDEAFDDDTDGDTEDGDTEDGDTEDGDTEDGDTEDNMDDDIDDGIEEAFGAEPVAEPDLPPPPPSPPSTPPPPAAPPASGEKA